MLPVSKKWEKYFLINYIPFLYLIIFIFLFPEMVWYVSNDNADWSEKNKVLHIIIFLLNLGGLQILTQNSKKELHPVKV